MTRNKAGIEEKNIKKTIVFSIISFFIIILTNLIAYKFLPTYVPMKSDGSNLLNKNLYVVFVPAISIIANYINIKFNKRSSANLILTNSVLPILNIWVIFSAIK
ncbi:hypothetical protein K8O96_09020 [Clostridium sporogenes]|uniref:DUF1648 domain-containing protein n=1 Tax=Clostridium botulinum TaxID=1491 RepID=A0A6M0SZZ0_CLOBO|nr:hypothetical protein [Clostridium sporogenes]NFA60693.1 hypothetical protein [Clostridium botulinum]NFI74143.1 hypothetical protein [Clostridium sporogenes]NFL71857.1 hypothetical protein [Clostridium sporogenes]NFM23963.1 hypothetical protein [Clostridium sporogenes]NFP62017.1 hypothetical protein [Clostridium sporogenes]